MIGSGGSGIGTTGVRRRSRFRTITALLTVFRLDRIYVKPARVLQSVWVDREASVASDHLPVIADLDGTELQAAQGQNVWMRSSPHEISRVYKGQQPPFECS